MSKDITENVNKLVSSIAHSKIDSANFKRCVDFVLYHISCEKYSIPNKNHTQELLENFVTKYDYLGFSQLAEEFDNCVENYSKSDTEDKYDDVEVKLRILEFLTKLSNEPYKTENLIALEDKLKFSRNVSYPEEIIEEECINWCQYLQEGSEKFKIPSDEDESADETLEHRGSHIKIDESDKFQNTVPMYNDIFKDFTLKETAVVDQKTMLLMALTESVHSKNWLSNHRQNSWWYDSHVTVPDSKYPSASFGIDWDKSQNTMIYSSRDLQSTKYQYYTEYKIIRELLWIMVANDQRIRNRIEFLRTRASVSSLIQDTFRMFLNDALDTATKYHDLRSFNEEIFNDNISQLPFTYQAYASVLRNICRIFLDEIVRLEKIVQKEEDIRTLLNVLEELKPYLKDIDFIHEVHCTSLHPNWRTEPPWLVTVRLLSNVHSKFQTLLSQNDICILLKIFFNTFKVYADFIDRWLTEGKLNDWKNEFYIQKLDDGTCKIFPCDDPSKRTDIGEALFFHKIANRLLNCSKNVDFLCKLNKITQLKSEILKEGKFIEVFLKEFTKRIFKRNSHIDESSSVSKQNQPKMKSSLATSNVEFLSQDAFNPYLVRAFGQELNIISEIHPPKDQDVLHELENLPDLEVFSVGTVIEEALYAVILRRENIVANLFKSSLVQEYRLFDHIRNLCDLLLMDLHVFCNRINIRLHKRIWEGNHILKLFLYDCVNSNQLVFRHLFHFTMEEENQFTENEVECVSHVIKIIDFIHLHYMVQWPMNMIFDDNIIKNFYEVLFKLVLKVNTAFSSVTRLYYKDLPHTKLFKLRLRKMQMFRYWVLQLLNKLRTYLSLIISQCLDVKLMEKALEINTFNSLQTHYSTYLEKVKKKCLIDPKIYSSLESAFNRIWRICDDVVDLWNKSIKLLLTDEDVTKSVELYVQCLWYFTQVLENFVKGKPNDNPLYDLWSDLSHMIEVHRSTIPEDLPFKYNIVESF